MSVGSLSEARLLAIEAHLKMIVLSEFAGGPLQPAAYIADPNFVPNEPQWLRQGITSRLEEALAFARDA